MTGLTHIARLPHTLATFLLAAFLCSNVSCSRVQTLREARTTIATADSLRAAGQQPYDSPSKLEGVAAEQTEACVNPPNSLALASAVTALTPLRTVHSRTRDHEIKARAYSNIGTLCHWGDDYARSYDMYQLSVAEFLLCQDSTMYYYDRNAMAFELARQNRLKESLALTDIIEEECNDQRFLTKIFGQFKKNSNFAPPFDNRLAVLKLMLMTKIKLLVLTLNLFPLPTAQQRSTHALATRPCQVQTSIIVLFCCPPLR